MSLLKFPGGLLAAALFAIQTPAIAGQPAAVSLNARGRENPLSLLEGKVVFDIQERVRVEARENNLDFDNSVDSPTDDAWLLQRFRIGLTVKPVDWLTVYVQGQDSREFHSDRPDYPGFMGAEGDDSFDLRQAYAEITFSKPVSLKVGRQVLSYGDERLIGGFDWNNIGRTFDAAKLHIQQELWWADLFAASVVVPERGSYNQSDLFNGNETDRDQVFSGLYVSTTAIPIQTTDVYLLHLHENTSRFAALPNNDTNFFTLGFRVKSKPGAFARTEAQPDGKSTADGKSIPAPAPAPKAIGFDYDAEVAFQRGEVRGLDLTAAAVHAGVGYTFDYAWKPRIGAEYNFASGDENPLDEDIETFQNLFPTNHKFYGYMDLFSWQNMQNPALTFRFSPLKNVTVGLDAHAFWVVSNEDSWYRANGVTAVRPLNREADSYAGSELDLTITWKPVKQLALLFGYSHFWAGDYLKATGASDDADFGYIQAELSF